LGSMLAKMEKDIAFTHWNTGLLWKGILVDLLSQMSKFTTSMVTELIIELKTLNSLLFASIQENTTIPEKTQQNGLRLNVGIVESILASVLIKLLSLNQTTALTNATLNICTRNQAISVKDVGKSLSQIIPSENTAPSNATGNIDTEVIIVAMKLLSEKTYVEQALKNRHGITWLDDGRIPFEADDDKYKYKKCGGSSFGVGGGIDGTREYPAVSNPQGRFPANLLVSDDVLDDGRIQKSGTAIRHNKGCVGSQNIAFTRSRPDWKEDYGFGDTGSFSRYFDLDKWFSERIKRLPESVQKTFPFLIVPKASKSEKNRGLDYEPKPIKGRDEGQDVRNMPYKARSTPRINQHPTCKPLKLMCYLITLGSREGDIVLDPFLGSGTTALACQLLGRGCIGIEISEEYCEIARSRCNQQVLI